MPLKLPVPTFLPSITQALPSRQPEVGRFDISRFKSGVAAKGGFSRANYFQCWISGDFVPAPTDIMSRALCKAVLIPQGVMEHTDVAYFTRIMKIPARRSFPSLMLTFYGTNDYSMRSSFEKWHNALSNAYLNTRDLVKYRADYALGDPIHKNRMYGDIYLDHYDVAGTQGVRGALASGAGVLEAFLRADHKFVAQYWMTDAFPTTISPMSFDYDNEQIQTFDVEFQYQYMTLMSSAVRPNVSTDYKIHSPETGLVLP